jgi:beta-lactamase class A
MNCRAGLLISCLLAFTTAWAAAAPPATDPRGPQAAGTASLWDRHDPLLQAGLEQTLRQHGLLEAARRGHLAVAVADITDLGTPRVAALNGDQMMYAASLPKIAILLGAFHKAQTLGIDFPAGLRADIDDMIRYSSNEAATRVLGWVGREELLALLQSPEYGLYDPAHNGGLWVGKDYASANAFHRDPLHNLSHGATAMQVARFYYLLEAGQLVDAARTREMKQVLGDPGIAHKLVKGLSGRPEARIYRKSGTWKNFHADSALIESGGRRLVLVALADDPRGGEWIATLAVPLFDLIMAGTAAGGAATLAHGAAR